MLAIDVLRQSQHAADKAIARSAAQRLAYLTGGFEQHLTSEAERAKAEYEQLVGSLGQPADGARSPDGG